MDPILLVAMVLFFWLLILRPQRRRAAQAQALQRSLSVGQRVMTSSGLLGEIVALTEDEVTLEVAPGTHTHWVRAAITSVLTTPEHKE